MRKQLEDYSEPLPTGLWEEIEKDLNQPALQPKVVPLWKRWQAVAAVVAVVLVSSTAVWMLMTGNGESTGQTSLVADTSSSEPSVNDGDVSDVVEEESSTLPAVHQVTQGVTSLLAAVAPSLVSADLDAQEKHPLQTDIAVVPSDGQTTDNEEIQESQEEYANTAREAREIQRKADREQLKRNALLAVADKSSASHGWQIGVTTGNSFSSASNNFQGLATLMSRNSMLMNDDLAMNSVSDNSMAYTQVLFHNRDQVTETRVHHRMPVTVGATLSYSFSDRWSVETGLTYTLLSSELHTGTQSYIEEEQKLHYVGIPLKVKHTFWQNRWVTVYAVAGGAVEKCVSGSLETLYVTGNSDRKKEHTSLDVKNLQWSVNAAVGGQFNMTRQLGLYVEPGISYYFDDGTGIETIRKEHPCNFNLQLGLRFTLPK